MQHQISGNFTLTNYLTTIFKEAGSTLTPNQSSIVVVLVQLIASFLAMTLVDRIGRKFLLVFSAFGNSIALICSGLYTLYSDQLISYKWIPILTFSLAIFVQMMGITLLYTLLLNEILPKKVSETHQFLIPNGTTYYSFFDSTDKKCCNFSKSNNTLVSVLFIDDILSAANTIDWHTQLLVFLWIR